MAIDVEMNLYDIQERYRTLAMYKVEVVGLYFGEICLLTIMRLHSLISYFMHTLFHSRLVRMNWS